jgi:hypothetical protein
MFKVGLAALCVLGLAKASSGPGLGFSLNQDGLNQGKD